jgi:hypothetical protein
MLDPAKRDRSARDPRNSGERLAGHIAKLSIFLTKLPEIIMAPAESGVTAPGFAHTIPETNYYMVRFVVEPTDRCSNIRTNSSARRLSGAPHSPVSPSTDVPHAVNVPCFSKPFFSSLGRSAAR